MRIVQDRLKQSSVTKSVAKAVFLQGRAASLWADICAGHLQGSASDCVVWLAASHPREPFSQSVQLCLFSVPIDTSDPS